MNHFSITFKIVAVAILFIPSQFLVSAQTGNQICSQNGYTVATINGVFTDEDEAIFNRDSLKDILLDTHNNQPLTVDFLLNPSHLGGIGDIVKSIQQGIFDQETVNDYDLVEMLKDASGKVQTQKLLLVAHSQGNFYANSFYDTVVAQNAQVSKESMGVYSVATPASRVAGDGKWLTSDTDTVIADIVGRVPFKKIMEPNASIALKDGDDFLGHDFANVYLKYKSARIIADIESSLNKLQTKNMADEQTPCITPPELTRAHKIEGALFAVVDPMASKSIGTIGAIANSVYQTGNAIATALVKGISSVANTLASVFDASPKEQTSAVAGALNQNDNKKLTAVAQNGENRESGAPVVTSADALLALEQKVALAERKTQALKIAMATVAREQQTALTKKSDEASSETTAGHSSETSVTIATREKEAPPAASPSPGFGGGGDAPPQPTISPSSAGTQTDTQTQTDTTPPSAPAIIAPADFLRTFTSSVITFSGTAEAGSTVSTNVSSATTTANQSGEWSFALVFNQGTTTAQFFATDSAGNISHATITTLFVDSTAPQTITPAIAECANSLDASVCLLAATTLSISWGASEAADFNYFMLNNNGTISTTTATSTTAVATNNTTYSFALSVVDKSGNASATTTVTAEINTSPVVINEIAWGGTNASTADEWVELYNKSSSEINLSGWTLYTADGAPYIQLSGSIAAGGYYLIERKNTGETDEAAQSSVKDITADLWTSFGSGLSNTGENLILARKVANNATTTIDEIPYCYNWCVKGSDSPTFLSMERFDADVSGADWANWGAALGEFILNGIDVNGGTIKGTPKARNSISYQIAQSPTLSENKIITKEHSPYIIGRNGLTIASGATLTLEAGTVIKIVTPNTPKITVNGTIVANGTATDKVVITSFADDTYGGDTNGDGACDKSNASSTAKCPEDWPWGQIYLHGHAGTSSFTNAVIRYGGRWYDNMLSQYRAMIVDEGTNARFDSVTAEYSWGHGLSMISSNGSVSNSIIRHNNLYNSSGMLPSGLYATGGAPVIENSQFSDNANGIYLLGSEARVLSNVLESNTSEAIYSSGAVGDGYFSGNSGSGNAWNGITLAGNITKTGITTTLRQNALPYLIKQWNNPTVVASSTLAIAQGVTLKFGDGQLFMNGDLSVSGTGANPVTFTSVYDDSDGNDASHNGASVGVAGNTQGTVLQSGSTSTISGAIFTFMKTALSYLNSPIVLSDTVFSDNILAVSADAATINNYPIVVSNVALNNNTTATSPVGLW